MAYTLQSEAASPHTLTSWLYVIGAIISEPAIKKLRLPSGSWTLKFENEKANLSHDLDKS